MGSHESEVGRMEIGTNAFLPYSPLFHDSPLNLASIVLSLVPTNVRADKFNAVYVHTYTEKSVAEEARHVTVTAIRRYMNLEKRKRVKRE